MGKIEKPGRGGGGGGDERSLVGRPLAFSIVLTDREPGTGYI